LYYRLNVVQIRMPPLRERIEDIPQLVSHFVRQLAPQLGVPAQELDPALLATMSAHAWPGNVRELRNVIERWLILGSFPHVYFGDKPRYELPDDLSLEAVEKQHILKVLAAVRGNKTEAGRRLGVSRKTLERKCADWGV
ncbi:MAG TPA: helix-turn-helix domain-containing protein, partial [Rhodocyclaceae bacterium]|nr:helix-turn-helix domain-containing protein [Rhodocyclaceae bacterium]